MAELPLAGEAEVTACLERGRAAQAAWSAVPVPERGALCSSMLDAFVRERDAIAEEISWQMGRPVAHSPGEVAGAELPRVRQLRPGHRRTPPGRAPGTSTPATTRPDRRPV